MAKAIRGTLHDFNARNDPKIRQLRADHGLEAYGLYWCIIEILRGYEDLTIPNKHLKGIADDCGLTLKKLTRILTAMVDLQLLNQTEVGYYSPSLTRRINAYRGIKENEISKNSGEILKNSDENSEKNSEKNQNPTNEFNHSNDLQVYSGISKGIKPKCIPLSFIHKDLNNKIVSENPDPGILANLDAVTSESALMYFFQMGLTREDFSDGLELLEAYFRKKNQNNPTAGEINYYLKGFIVDNVIERKTKKLRLSKAEANPTNKAESRQTAYAQLFNEVSK